MGDEDEEEDKEKDVQEGDENYNEAEMKSLWYIGKAPKKACDDSPLANIIYYTEPDEDEFTYKGHLILTDGKKRPTKLTKIFKRRDNKHKLYGALKKMGL